MPSKSNFGVRRPAVALLQWILQGRSIAVTERRQAVALQSLRLDAF